ncbi:MAG TPA: COX15/CtaA family protein [Thermoplasmata archaeon]|nr:COX15/CtaA family protein [Thermoplasmata archaeon]
MRGHDLFRYAAVAALVACYVTIILGGNVIASDSGLGCPSWPACNGSFTPLPTVSGASAVEWAHRVSAFFLAVALVILSAFALAYERRRPVLLKLSLFSLALVVALALLGGAVVDSSLNLALVLLHFALATILFGVLLILVLLSNLRSLSRRWVTWAVKAGEEREVDPYALAGADPADDGAARPGSSPGPEG